MNGHLDLYDGLDLCDGLVYSLSDRNLELLGLDNGGGGSLEPLGLDNGGHRPDSSGGNSWTDVREAGERVLHLCDFFIKVFDAVL